MNRKKHVLLGFTCNKHSFSMLHLSSQSKEIQHETATLLHLVKSSHEIS
ncbi:hypothetical protein OIU76_026720 [Salix suchowensis]|nr:hypothetical protein OIU76_026720 [Salix suchowensis]